MNGYGEYEWPDGRVYLGKWKISQMHGSGKLIFPDGTHHFHN